VSRFQTVQYQNGQKSKDNVARQYRIANPAATDEDVRRLVESDQGGAFSQQVLRTPIDYRHPFFWCSPLGCGRHAAVAYGIVLLTRLFHCLPSGVG
jgi:hypothetical protein